MGSFFVFITIHKFKQFDIAKKKYYINTNYIYYTLEKTMGLKAMSLNTKIKLVIASLIVVIIMISTACYYSKNFSLVMLSLIASAIIIWAASAIYLYLDNFYYFANEYRTTKSKVLLWIGAVCKIMEFSKPLTPIIPVFLYIFFAKLV